MVKNWNPPGTGSVACSRCLMTEVMYTVGMTITQARGVPMRSDKQRRRLYLVIRNMETEEQVQTGYAHSLTSPQWNSRVSMTVDSSTRLCCELVSVNSDGKKKILARKVFVFDDLRNNTRALKWFDLESLKSPENRIQVEMSFNVTPLSQPKSPKGTQKAPVDPRSCFVYVPTYWNGMAYLTPMEVTVIDSRHIKLKNSATVPQAMPFVDPSPVSIKSGYAKDQTESYEEFSPIDRLMVSQDARYDVVEKVESPGVRFDFGEQRTQE